MANIGGPMRRHQVIPDHLLPDTTEPNPSSLPATKPEMQPSESPELRRNNWLALLAAVWSITKITGVGSGLTGLVIASRCESVFATKSNTLRLYGFRSSRGSIF
jgi:hypothetical protein